MPLPTAAELTDPNATNTQMKQRLGRLAEEVASKEDVFEKFNDISKKSANIFNKKKILANTSISTSGVIEADSLRWLSDYMEISLGETLQVTAGTYRIALFDANKQFITRTGTVNNEAGNATYTNSAISLAKYFRISGTNNADEVMLNKGSTLLPFEKFGTFIKTESIPKIEQEFPIITPEMTDFFVVSKNLFDKSKILANTSISTSGVIEADSLRWLSDYMEISLGETLQVTAGTYRIALFDANKQFITRTGTVNNEAGNATYTIPATVSFIRISSDRSADGVMVNKGENLLAYEDFGIFLKSSYIQKVENNNEDNEENTVTRPLFEQAYEPSFPTLSFAEVEQTWRRPYWMSEDGAIIYGAYGAQLIQSKDEWATKVQIGTVSLPQTILAIRTLADGELLIYCSRNEAQSVKGKLYKTVGYDRNNPSVATFKEVFEIISTQADINNTWGLSVYQNIVVASEYGLRGANGAKHVYLSTDCGETFSLIFNLYTQAVAGRPALTDSAHTHTAAYDPYYNRIWIVVGDRPNTASYFSDDLGQTWTFIRGSDEVQYTGIQALPDCVIFGSDRAPNGVYVYYRNGKDKHPVIQPLFIINDSEELTNVFGLPFKKDWHPQSPTYFVADKTEGTSYKPQIIATVDGRKAHFMYEHSMSVRMWAALGPTAQGNIITVIQSEPSPNGLTILKAPAPSWIKL